MLRIPKKGLFAGRLLAAILLFVMMLSAGPVLAQTGSITASESGYAGEFQVAIGKSRVLRVSRPYTDLLVGDPQIADVVPLSDRSVYVLGRQVGSTSLVVYGEGRSLVAAVDLSVTPDTDTLKRRLHDVLPGEAIEVRSARDSIILSGSVSSPDRLTRAAQLAERFAPGAVTNMMTVRGSQQVLLEVRFAEVQRRLVRELGLNTQVLFQAGANAAGFVTGLPFLTGLPNLSRFGTLFGRGQTGNWTLSAMLDALEQNGLITTLAEPNLIALSGETANFLAGGEFPIPVAQSSNGGYSNTITVEFKQFGVSLAFTPTVLGNGLISLVVAPEVSAIDPTSSFRQGDLVIPGLTTRRARTTVELRDGQSFAIAGLISNDLRTNIDGLPGINDVPILGALFRSTQFQRRETELVIIVTPHLAAPAAQTALAQPTDTYSPPTDADLFLRGQLEQRLGSMDSGRGGLDGSVGHRW